MQATAVAAPHAPHRALPMSRKVILAFFGVVPLGVYVVLHLWTNLTALDGAEAFDAALQKSRSHPAFLVLEIFGLGIPLMVHTVLGLREIVRGRQNLLTYTFFDNLKFFFQRLSAVGLALFIGAHLWRARILPSYVECKNPPVCSETWMGMHYALSEWPTFIVYALGLLGVSYHLANGLQTASMRLGLVVSRPAQARVQWISWAALAILLAMSAATMYGFQPFQAPFAPGA